MSGSVGEEEDDAVRAFEALRDEVASLRKGIELVYRQVQEAKGVDYSLTLGQMAKTLQAVQERLATIEEKPALAMMPENYRALIEDMERRAGQKAEQALRDGIAAQSAATRELADMIGHARGKRAWRGGLLLAVVGGVMAGVLAWTLMVENLPWGMGTWLAAVPIAGNKWDAGVALLREADPEAFRKMSALYTTCGQQPVEFCQQAIAEKTVDSARHAGVASTGLRHKARP